jgi:CRP-like cAMP-binding protein
MRNLLAEQSINRYNTEDVIIVQNANSHGYVYLILTGYCEVVRQKDGKRQSIATLQAGDIIGEMAMLTGSGVRNASVVARTPVTVCVFYEETFRNFIGQSGLQHQLESRWLLRPVIKSLPQYQPLSSTVADKISRIAESLVVLKGETAQLDDSHLYLFVEGEGTVLTAEITQEAVNKGDEFGWRPFTENNPAVLAANTDCGLLKLEAEAYLNLLYEVPQLNYQTRKRLIEEQRSGIDWLLGEVKTY